MRLVCLTLSLATLFYACNLKSKMNLEISSGFDLIETKMAEIKAIPMPDKKVSKQDSSVFLKFWSKFYAAYKSNDIESLCSMSQDSVETTEFNEIENRFQQESKYVSFKDFVRTNIWNNPPVTPRPYYRNEPYFVTYRYEYNPDTIAKQDIKNSIQLRYRVLVEAKKIKGYYEIKTLFILSFIKKQGRIRFSGMQIYGDPYPQLVFDSITPYFPLQRDIQNHTIKNELDSFTNLSYSATLTGFKEPNLCNYSGEDETYRFTWIRSFHNPVTIKFQKHQEEYILTTKEMIDYKGYAPNEWVVNTSRNLSALVWHDWEVKIGRLNFWNMQSIEAPENRPTDGSDWILEANVKSNYHFVSRFSIEPGFQECCRYLIRLSKLKIPEADIY